MEKKKIVVIDDHIKSSKLYASSLEVYCNMEVTTFSHFDDSIANYLKENNFDAVITRPYIGDLKIDHTIYKLIESINKSIPLYILGKSKLSIHSAKIFRKDFEISDLIRTLAFDFDITPHSMANLDLGDFYSFKTNDIMRDLVLVCDIYIKKNDSYSKLLSKDSTFSTDIKNLLNNQNLDKVFVTAKERLNFINSQLIYFQELFAEDQLSINDEFMLSSNAYRLIKSNILEMNISTEVILTTEKCINTIFSLVQKISTLKELFKTLSKSENVDFNQTVMLCFFCNHIVGNVEWGTNEQKVKLSFVSFFHNITLPSEYVLINDNEQLEKMNLTIKQKKIVLMHALESAKLVSKFKKKIPFGVDTIIKQHHGAITGMGFNSFPQSISPLAIIFLVVDEWVTNILRAQGSNLALTKKELMNIVKKKYKTLSFEKVISAFEKIDVQ